MIKFLIKLFIFFIPLLLFMEIPKFTKYIMDADLEAKINTFLPEGNNVELIIAGDSRAERQLIPAIFKSELGIETVNIAKDVGDVISLEYANKKYGFADSSKVFVICVSSLTVNDGAYKNWFMSQASMTEIGLLKQILLFKFDFPENWYRRMGLIWDELTNPKRNVRLKEDDIRLLDNGLYPIDKQLDKESFFNNVLDSKQTEHLWYRRPNNNGIRKRVFEKSVKQFTQTGAKIVFIQSPMAPSWRQFVGDNYMHRLEMEHSRFLINLAEQYQNVWTVDLYTNQSKIFTDDLFYGSTHINITGAEVFTQTVIDSMRAKSIL